MILNLKMYPSPLLLFRYVSLWSVFLALCPGDATALTSEPRSETLTVSGQPSFLQLLPGDDVRGEVQLVLAVLVLLLLRLLGAGVELPEAFSRRRRCCRRLLSLSAVRLLLSHRWREREMSQIQLVKRLAAATMLFILKAAELAAVGHQQEDEDAPLQAQIQMELFQSVEQ